MAGHLVWTALCAELWTAACCCCPSACSRTPSYTTYIDGPSWTDYFLLTELTKNPDGYRWVPGSPQLPK